MLMEIMLLIYYLRNPSLEDLLDVRKLALVIAAFILIIPVLSNQVVLGKPGDVVKIDGPMPPVYSVFKEPNCYAISKNSGVLPSRQQYSMNVNDDQQVVTLVNDEPINMVWQIVYSITSVDIKSD